MAPKKNGALGRTLNMMTKKKPKQGMFSVLSEISDGAADSVTATATHHQSSGTNQGLREAHDSRGISIQDVFR